MQHTSKVDGNGGQVLDKWISELWRVCLHGSYKMVQKRKIESDNERIMRGCIARNYILAWGKFLNILDRCKNKILVQSIRVFLKKMIENILEFQIC